MSMMNTVIRLTIGKRILSVLVVSALVFLGLYIYFVSTSVINILVRKEIEQKIALVNSYMSDLEAGYLTRKNEITLEYAYAQGFSNVTDKHFATRVGSPSNGLTLNRE